MAAPSSLTNTNSQSLDTMYADDGTQLVKGGITGPTPTGLDPAGGWAKAASHAEGATFASSDGVQVVAGVEDGGSTVYPLLTDANGYLKVQQAPAGGNLTDGSGTLTTGATSEQMFAANTSRRFLFIMNMDASEDMYIDFGTTAVQSQPSILIGPEQSLKFDGGFVPTQAVNVIATTVSHPWTAKEG